MVVLLQACDATLLKGFDNHLIGGFCVGLSSDRNAAHDDDDGDLPERCSAAEAICRCDESRCLFYGTTLRATRRKSLLPRDSTHLPKSPPASGEKRSRSELVAASGENARSEGKKRKKNRIQLGLTACRIIHYRIACFYVSAWRGLAFKWAGVFTHTEKCSSCFCNGCAARIQRMK